METRERERGEGFPLFSLPLSRLYKCYLLIPLREEDEKEIQEKENPSQCDRFRAQQ
jgi:hypothetical protein